MLCIILPPSFFFFAFHCIPTIKYKTSDSPQNKGLHSCYFATSTLWAPSKAHWSRSLSIDFKRLWKDSFLKLYLNMWCIFKAGKPLMHWRFHSLLQQKRKEKCANKKCTELTLHKVLIRNVLLWYCCQLLLIS